MRLKTIIGLPILVILSPVILIILWISFAIIHGTTLRIMGYDVDTPPDELAQKIYDEGDSVSRCMKLRRAVPTMGPTLQDKQWNCVLEYAHLAKDPTACKLLMPSEYGLTCVGYAIEKSDPCFISMNSEVRGEGIKTTIQECFNGSEQTKNNDCCVIARITKDSDHENCAGLNDVDLWNQCQAKLAFEKKDSSYCGTISVENSRIACEVITEAIRNDPSIIE